ncbi:transposase [Rhodovulum imhoffii]|uniref:Transposase n=1 Tax=Rhodovulum imhoffii TaxID=365340 RepID=A0A2T5BP02_9RHOB|nr:transposase [Rhodovulum imhoffii]
MGNGNRPTPEFRREAVRLALTSGRTRREIAEDLGIGLSTLTRWLSQERDASDPSEAPVDLHAELKRLSDDELGLRPLRRFWLGIVVNVHNSGGIGNLFTGDLMRDLRYTVPSGQRLAIVIHPLGTLAPCQHRIAVFDVLEIGT